MPAWISLLVFATGGIAVPVSLFAYGRVTAKRERRLARIEKRLARIGRMVSELHSSHRETHKAIGTLASDVEELQDKDGQLDLSVSVLRERMKAHDQFRQTLQDPD